MDTITAYTVEGVNEFTLDNFVQNDTIALLHFIPKKESPEKVRMVISTYQKDNTLVEEHFFDLQLDCKNKCYKNSIIGLKLDGMHQKIIFKAFDIENGLPLNKICIGIAITKIKDGDGEGGIYLKPRKPRVPLSLRF